MFVRFPRIIPIIALLALPSARITLLNTLPMIKNGTPNATMTRYCLTYSMVLSVAPTSHEIGSLKIRIASIPTTPTPNPVQKQKEQAFLASAFRPCPNRREIREVPPIPNSIPIAINSKKAGVAWDTAATINAFFVCPIKKVSARLYTKTISILTMDGMIFKKTALGIGAFSNISVDFFFTFVSSVP